MKNIKLVSLYCFVLLTYCISFLSYAQVPVTSNGTPSESFSGEQFCFAASFSNTGAVGYGPYYRVILPSELTLNSASIFGQSMTPVSVGTFPAAPGNQLTDPLSQASVTGTAGYSYHNIELPLGSVVTNGPALASTLCVTIDANATIGNALTVDLQPNYRFGDTATGANGAIQGTNVTANVTPTLFAFSASQNAAESELVPGSQFQATLSFTTDVANGKTIDTTSLTEVLASNLQYVGPTSITGGTGCTAASEPSTSTPGGSLNVTCTGITGSASSSDVTVSFPVHIIDTLDETTCTVAPQVSNSTFDASFSGSGLTQATGTTSITAKHVAIQQSASASASIPGGTVTFTDTFQVSAFATADSIVITDTLADGYTFASHTSMTVAGGGVSITPTVTANGDGTTTIVYNVTAVTGNLSPGSEVTIVYTATIDQDFNSAPDPILAGDSLGATSSLAYTLTAGASGCTDTSSSSVTITPVSATKTLVNGQAAYLPGETVTFRFQLDVPSGDTETIAFTDYLPLPVFDASAVNTTFGNDVTAAPADTVGATPVISTDAATNSVTMSFPNLTNTTAQTIAVDLAVTVTSDPFADELALTNILQVTTTDTSNSTSTQLKTAQINTRAPVLSVTLGANASDHGTVSATVADPTTALANGDVTSTDAGDTTTYVLTIENTGGAPATNVVATVASVTGMGSANITSIIDGAGTDISSNTSGTLESGLNFGTYQMAANDGTQGAPFSTDSIIITFTRTIAADVNPRQSINTTASVDFASINAATKFSAVTEDSATTVAGPSIASSINSIAPGGGTGGNFVVGDVVTYLNTVTLPEGQTDTLILSATLPAGLEYAAGSVSVDTTGFVGTVDTAPTVGTSGDVSTGQTVTITFDSPSTTSVTNDNNSSNNSFALTLNANVNDVAANAATSTLQSKNLSSSLTYTGVTGSPITDSASGNFSEHDLAITASVSPSTGLDAGDTVTVTLEVTNNGTAPAYDLSVTDTISSSVFDTASVTEGTTPAGYTFSYVNPTITISANNGTTLAAGASATFTYTLVIADGVETGSSYTVDASVTGSSQEDNGGTAQRSDSANNSTTASTQALTSDSIILTSTSESWTSDTAPIEVAIGEVLTYQYTVTIPEGVTTDTPGNSVIEVTLPAGYQFISGTGLIRGVFDTGLSGATSGALTTSDAAIVPSVSAQTLSFDLGDVTNSDDDANAEQIIVSFDVVVSNTSDTNRTDSKTITGAIHYNNAASSPQTASSNSSATVAESNMSMSKTASPSSVSGGDTVTFTLVATNTAGTNVTRAWEWTITDNLPARFQSPSITSGTLSRGSTDVTACASFSGQQLTMDSTCLSTATDRYLDAGESITLIYTATVDSNIGFEETITNTANVAVTSLPGTNGTGSTAPGAADSDTGERTGSGNNNTSAQAVNDLNAMDSATVTSSAPTLSVVASASQLPIGDSTVLTGTVSIPTGTTNNFVYTLDLPTGLSYNGQAITINNLGSITNSNSPSTTPGAGTDPVVLDFGNITNSTGSGVDLSIAVPVTIDNILANQNTTTLTSTGSLSYQNITASISDTATVTVIEANLSITQTITAGAAGSDAGDTVSYQTVVQNTSASATAYRVAFANVAPAGLLGGNAPFYSSITVDNDGGQVVLNGTSTGVTTGDAVTSTTTNTNDTLGFPILDIPPGASLTITWNMTLANNVSAGSTITNNASANYNSLASGGGRDNSNSGDDDNDAALNNYGESDSSSLTVDSSVAVQAGLNATHSNANFTIGDSVTFDIRADVIEGTTGNVTLTVVLPSDMSYSSSTGVTAGGHISYDGAATVVEAPTGTLTINFGTVTNTSDGNTANDFFTLGLVAQVNDAVGNTANTQLTTSASLTSDAEAAGPDTQIITVTEPNLTASIVPNTSSPSLGDTVTLTVTVGHSSSTADAFDTGLTIAIPTGLSYVTGSHSGSGSVNESNTAAPVFSLGTITQADMNKSFTFDVTVNGTVNVNDSLSISVSSGSYDGQSGTPAVQRSYNMTASASISGDTDATLAANQTLTLFTDNNSNGIADSGDVLQISAVISNGGSTVSNVVFTEGVPANTTYVGSSLTTSAGSGNETNSNALTANIGTMNNGDSVTVTFRATVNSGLPAGLVLFAQGSVDSDSTVPEPTDADGIDANGDQANQMRIGSLNTAFNDLYILQSYLLSNDADADNNVSPGDTLTIYYDVQNPGSTTLTGVTLADTIPSGLTYVVASATASGGGNTASVTGAALSAAIASLSPFNSEQISFQVTVDNPLSGSSQTFQMQGTGNSSQTDAILTDSNGQRSDGSQALSINATSNSGGSPVLAGNLFWSLVSDVDSDADVDDGDTLLLTAVVQNIGSSIANNVGYSFSIPSNTSLVTGSTLTSQGIVNTENPLAVNLGNLAVGATAVIKIRVTVNSAVADGTVLSAQGSISADNASNVSTDDNGNSADGVNPTLIRVASGTAYNPTPTLAFTNVTDSTRTAGNTFIQSHVLQMALTVTMPEGPLNDAVLNIVLPDNFSYVIDSARLTRNFDTGLNTSGNPGSINVANSGTAVNVNSVIGNSANTLSLALGDVINSDNDVNGETLVFSVQVNTSALVPTAATENFTFNASIVYRNDLAGQVTQSDTHVVTLENQTPVAIADSQTVAEDATAVAITVISNDSDADVGQTLDVTAVSGTSNGGSAVLNANDTISYQPAANFNGTETFTYTLSDGITTAQATVTVTVTAVNDPPVGNNDTASTNEDTLVENINVLGNDTDVENDSLSVQGVPTANNGVVTVNGDNTLNYTPNTNFNGTDTITYTVTDSNLTDTATVTVTVTAVNDPPVGNNDTASTSEDTPATNINVLANDSDVDNDSLSVQGTPTANNGVVTVNDDNTLNYTPNANFNGTDTITYTVTDSNLTDTATVTVTVTAVNDPPATANDTATTAEDTPVTNISVLANDSDVENSALSISVTPSAANGVVTLNGDNTLNYTPNANFNGVETITYTVTDGTDTNTGTLTITVTAVNDAPVASNDTASTNEDTPANNINVLGNDTDVENDSLSVQGTPSANNGVVTVNSDNTLNYTPNANFNGTDTITYTITDGNLTDTATVTVTVTAVNDPPATVNDTATTTEDTPVTNINVLANDSDVENSALSISVTPSAANGVVTVNGDNTLDYTPNANFNGVETITYTVTDGTDTNTGTLTITVTAVNDAPVANNDTASTNEDTPANNINVLGNDTDVENDRLSVQGTPSANNGVVTVNSDNTLNYTPNANFNGTDTITYTVTDGNLTDTATVTVTVTAVNDPPATVNDTATTAEDTPVTNINVLANDSDVENSALSISVTPSAANGVVTVNGDNTLDYTPNANFNGVETITYTVTDGTDTNTGTLTITVTAVNDAPVATNDTASTNEDTPATNINVLANDTDVENDSLSVQGTPTANNGVVTVNSDNTLNYTPNANFNGTDTITYTITDGNLTDTATVTVTVIAVNDAPATVNDTATTAEDTPVTNINVLANDSDVENSALSISTTPSAANGVVTVNGDNTLNYTPNANFNGVETITYTVTDGTDTNTGTLTITVTAVNDAPVASNDTASTNEDTPATIINVLANDTDVENDSLSVQGTPTANNGVVTVNSDNTLNYTPNANFNGTDTITYTITDGNLTDTATVTVTVSAVNDAPVAVADTATTDEDTPAANINVLANDTDVENDTLSISGTPTAINGVVTVNSDNTLTYTPNANFNGTDTISYVVSDGNNGSNSGSVTVTVNAINDAPVANNDTASTNEDTPATNINVLANDTDVENDSLSVQGTPTANNGVVTVNSDNTLNYTPNANFNGTDTITYTVTDGNLTDTATVTVTVTAVNDAPVAVADTATTDEDTPAANINVLANDTDVENDTLSISGTPTAINGVVTVNSDNTLTYTPNANFNGTDTISYVVSDGNNGSNSGSVTVTVNAINDAPVANNDTASTNEDTPATNINVLANDTDVENDSLSVQGNPTANNGVVTVNSDNTLNYTPNANFNGTDTITYVITDGSLTATATVTITVGNVNDVPVAQDDIASTNEDEALTLSPLANDSDTDNDTLTVTTASSDQGEVTINTDGTLLFTPTANFNGVATINYSINDGNGGTASAVITVTVTPVADAPVANDDVGSVGEDGSTTINVLGNDIDVDGDTLTVTQASSPNGDVVINSDGSLLFTPAANFNGTTTITYSISDGHGGNSSATVTVTVNSANDVPVAVNDIATFTEDSSGNNIVVLANDSDADGDTLSVTSAIAQNGQVTVNSDGSLSYTPDSNFNGIDSISYTIDDGNGGVATATVSVTVTPVNDVPVAVDDTASVGEDGSTTINVLANDSDADGDTLTVTQATSGQGTVTINNDNTLLFAPSVNFNGSATISYTVSDDNGGTATATVTISVNPANDIPEAQVDEANVSEDSTNNPVNVLANDSDADGDVLTVTSAVAQNGQVIVNADNSLSYTPNANFNGTDTITYSISDGNGGTATATVTVTVSSVNDLPVALDDSTSVNENSSVTVAVLANDSDLDGDGLTVTQASSDNGNVTINGDGSITFTPTSDFTGNTSISYTISDGNGGEATAQVAVTVINTNDAPVANNDNLVVSEDSINNQVNVLSNDTDPDNDTLTVTSANAQNGSVTINGDNTLNYTPPANFNGSDTITYVISDPSGETATATVSITVNAVNDIPVANPDIASGSEDTVISNINVLGNDTDPDGDSLTVSQASAANGSVVINADGTLSYTPNANFNGSDTISYSLSDGSATVTGTVAITIAPVNDIPVANNDNATVAEDSTLTNLNVLANDSDADGDTLQLLSASASNGTVTVNANGTLNYTPNNNFNGTDTIIYVVSDGNGGSATGVVTVSVGGVNDVPVALNDTSSTNEDEIVTILPLLNDSDGDGDTLTITSASSDSGSVSIVSGTSIVFTPDANFNGTASINYSISDGNGGTSSAVITVTVAAVNDNPVAVNDTATVNSTESVNIDVLSNDSDVDGDTLQLASASASNGTVQINDNGSVTYNPTPGFSGTDLITYSVSDGNGGSAIAIVTVTVVAQNSAPVALDDSAEVQEDSAINVINVLSNDTDIDGDALVITSASAPNGIVSINQDGTLNYIPDDDFSGADTISYTISDGNGGTASALVSVNVVAVNDGPVAQDDSATVDEDSSNNVINVLGNDSDVDGDILTISSASAVNGQVSIAQDGTLSYTPGANFSGTDIIIYTVSDGNGGNATAQVTVSVTNINDVPVANPDIAGVGIEGQVAINVLENDTDADGDALTLVSAVSPDGTVTLNNDGTGSADGVLLFVPAEGFSGETTITYTVSDGNGGTDQGTVTVTVNPDNNAPVANDDAATVAEDSADNLIDVLANDSDPEQSALTITQAQAQNGTATITSDGQLSYTPNANFAGEDTIVYTISDGSGGFASATVVVTVNNNNDAPVALDDVVQTDEEQPVVITPLSNDSDADGDVLTITASSSEQGSVIVDSQGQITFTPNPDFAGTAQISYSINDGNGGSSSAVITVTVQPVQDPPVAQNDIASVGVSGETEIAVLANDTDVDGDSLTITQASSEDGTVTISDTGILTFVANTDFTGETQIAYTISDGNGGFDAAVVIVSVNRDNTVPEVNNDAITLQEDAAAQTIAPLQNDSDVDGDTLTITQASSPNGDVSINADGTLSYTPDPDFSGEDVITYTVSDGNGGVVSAEVIVTITAVNDAPVLASDTSSIGITGAGTITVLDNDVDADGDPLTITQASSPDGVVTINDDGSLYFVPNADFVGNTTISYTVSDGNGGTATATVTVGVNPDNNLPVANDDEVSVGQDSTGVVISPLSNDTDQDGDSLSITAASAPNGTVTINADGTLSYTPNPGFTGLDQIIYVLSDGNFGSTQGKINISVTEVNQAPVALDDELSGNEDNVIIVQPLANDSDADGDLLTVLTATTAQGSVIINEDGSLQFTPEADFSGTAFINYSISDGNGGTASAVISINVLPVQDPPQAVDDTASVGAEGFAIIDVLSNDVDPDGDSLTVQSASSPNGTVVINDDGTITFTPDVTFVGTTTITYVVSDGNGNTSEGQVVVSVNPGNRVPEANTDSLVVEEDSTGNAVDVLTNDSDADGDSLTVTQASAPNGSVTVNVDGSLSYTPNADFNGADVITYVISDGNGGQATGVVNVTVNSLNDSPVASDDIASTLEDQAVSLFPLSNDSDVDGDSLTITSATSEQGSVSIGTDGSLVFTPTPDFNGIATISYSISDGNGGTATAQITIQVGAVQDVPVANDDSATVVEGGSVDINVLANDTDADGDRLQVTEASSPDGTVVIGSDGTLTFTPRDNFSGATTITYSISDGKGNVAAATVNVNVTPVNDAPVAVDDSFVATEDTPVILTPLSNDSDPDGDALTISSATSEQGQVTINSDGTLLFTPNANFNGVASITYTINDGNGETSTAIITVSVAAVQDPPVANDDIASVGVTGSVDIDVLANDSDPDGDALTVTDASSPNGQVIINDNGIITFIADSGFNGETTITYTISDPFGNTDTAIVTVTVNQVNTPPVALDDALTVEEDSTGTRIDVLANDSDVDGDSLTITQASAQNGTVIITEDGQLIYTPNSDFNGSDVITYIISDGNGGTATATVFVTVTPVNDPPVANDDSASLGADNSVVINVLANDSDVDGDTLTVTDAVADSGTVSINADGTLLYVADAGFTGTATITYTIDDGNGGTAVATVTITVNAANQLPIANADVAEVLEDSSDNSIDVLNNDSDPDGDTLTVTSATAVNGTVTINPDGTLSYTPAPDFNGIDTITYEISDGNGGTAIATVTVTVVPVNDPPVAADDVVTVELNSENNVIAPLVNDSDIDGDPLTVVTASAGNGSVTINPDGTISYTPNANFTGTDEITYTISDGNGGEATATISVTVFAPNLPPVAVDDNASTDINTAVTISPLLNDSDPDGDNLVLVSATTSSGTATVNVDGTITFTPEADFVGVVTIEYQISDGNGGIAIGVITITVVDNNRPPVINPFNISTQVDVPVTIDIFSVASDPDIEPVTISSAVPDSGTVTINEDGTIVFTPDAGFLGDVNIVVCVVDPRGLEACGTFVVSVVASNLPPQVFSLDFVINEDDTLPLDLTGTDPENQPLTYTQLSDPTGLLTGVYPRLTYAPPANFNGSTSFTYQANDGELDSNIGTVNITVLPVNDVPVAVDDNTTIQFAQPVTVSPLDNDFHPDGDTISLVGATPQTGTLEIQGNQVIFTPVDGFVGDALIDYSITDSDGDIATAVITVTVLVDEASLFPVITLPPDVLRDANALFTKIDLGVASAVDRFGNPLPVSTVDGVTFYEPGNNTAFWSATDDEGRTSIASQAVRVRPLVSLEKDQDVLEGHTVEVGVHLNGTSPEYPLEIPYTVTGSANAEDHDLVSGSIVFESGSDEIISFEVFSDPVFEGEETIIITLSDTLNRGNKFQHVITINEENVNPDVSLFAEQDNEERVVVDVNGGLVTITSNVTHPDPSRQFSYSWQSLDADFADLDQNETTFTLDPSGLDVGIYRIRLDVTDTESPDFSDNEKLFLDVRASLPQLEEEADTDGDGIPDSVEGLKDSDGDGIADFNDPIPECNVLPQEVNDVNGYLIEGDPGVCTRLGNFSINSGEGGAKVSDADIANFPGIGPDEEAANVGGIFDFIAYGLPEPGTTHRIVTPLLNPIPRDAVYRKFIPETGWGSFVVTDRDKVWSSPGEPGYCFPTGGDIWVEGLVEGYWCVQVEIVDGGPNDADGEVNGTVVDPGGVSVLVGQGVVNQQPVALDDSTSTEVNTSVTVDALVNDSDPDGDSLVITSANPNFGSAEVINNQVSYTPPDGYLGEVKIAYGISDNNGGSASATIFINVVPGNAPPVAVDDLTSAVAGQTVTIDAIANDSDPDGDAISIINVIAVDGNAVINADGSISFTPDINFSGTTLVIYQIRDTFGGIDEAIITVLVESAAAPERIENSGGGGGSSYWLLYLLLLSFLWKLASKSKTTARKCVESNALL